MIALKTWANATTSASVVALTGLTLLLPGCQTLNFFGVNSANQTQKAPLSGSLQFNVRWPAFKTQALNQNTQRLLVGVYQGAFTGFSSITPTYFILEAGQESVLFEKLAIGSTRVFCLAFSADNTLLNGDIETATVEANQRKPVVLDLQQSPFSGLSPEETQALQQWVTSLFPIPSPTESPLAQNTSQSPAPLASPDPTPTPGIVASAKPSPTANPLPSPTSPSASPSTGSRGGSSSSGGGSNGGGGGGGGQAAGEIESEITIDDGAPRPDTVVIQ